MVTLGGVTFRSSSFSIYWSIEPDLTTFYQSGYCDPTLHNPTCHMLLVLLVFQVSMFCFFFILDDICVTCPHDRTLIARPGLDRVMLQQPDLTSCYGYRMPRDVKFVPMYGPKFGSLLQKGSYKILGQIKYKNTVSIDQHHKISLQCLLSSDK